MKSYLYSGRMAGRNIFAHEWLLKSILFMKKGYRIGFPVEGGIGVFEFKGIIKPKEPKIWMESFEEIK